ncbi:MAG: flagellar biosynthetic protein FliO [Lachnospiraceae bacterium]|nr:flagellar biosynthetic protein FliO [Lachnospiraceae bacterium]
MLLTPGGGGIEAFVQFITVLILFCVVLAITYVTTRYIAKFQKLKQEGSNIAVIETCRIAPNKYIQIVKLGEKYIAVAVCKETVTKLAELSEEELVVSDVQEDNVPSFACVLEKAKLRKQKK